jgi:putative PIN family toxin of toxin-antitoxin system
MQLFVIDTNVVVAGLITTNSQAPTACILDAMLSGQLIYLLSPALLSEYRAVLLRPKLCRLHGLTEVEVDHLLSTLVANALWREPPDDAIHTAPDPGDSHLWALLALDNRCCLVTGDQLLLQQPRPGSQILTPADCLSML